MHAKRHELTVGARLAANTIRDYHDGDAYRVTMVDEKTILVELLDPSTIGFGPADRIVEQVRGEAGTSAEWLDGHDAA